MRLRQLDLIAYGCFTNLALDFAGPEQAFHVIYGPNEAGKSTALRALVSLFFGIDARTSDAFRHKPSELRIRAELERSDGARLTVVRRKGNKNTLRDPDENPIPPGQLADFLGGATREIYASLYRLDHPALRNGGDELLAGQGGVAESLFQAGTGVRGLHEVLASLHNQAEALFKPRGSTAPINASLRAYDEARQRSRDAAASPREWLKRDQELQDRQAELQADRARLAELRSARERLKRFKLALPHVTRYRTLASLDDALRDAPMLPESASGERIEAVRRRQQALRLMQESERELAELRTELARLNVPQPLLDQAAAVSRVCEQLTSYRNALGDLPQVRSKRRQHEEHAAKVLRDVRPDLSLAQAESLRLTELQRARIKRLASERATLVERQRHAGDLAEEARAQWAETNERLRALPAVPDVSGLEKALERARKPGDLEAEQRQRYNELASLEQEVDRRLARLPLWAGTKAQIETLPVPAVETVEEAQEELRELTDDQRRLDDKKEEIDQRRAHVKQAIRALQTGGAVPTEYDLMKVRAERDRSWQLVRRAWIDGQRDLFDTVDSESHRELAAAYQQKVQEADTIADRLRREAERVARHAELLAEQTTIEAAAKDLKARRQELSRRRDFWTEKWQQAWAPTGITPLSPREMRSWLGQHKDLCERFRTIRQLRQRIEQLEQLIGAHQAELSEALAAVAGPAESSSLAGRMDQAEAYLARARQTLLKRTSLEQGLEHLARQQQKANDDAAKARQEIAAWTVRWQAALAPLGLAPDVEVDQVATVLGELEAMFQALHGAAQCHERIGQMERHNAQFEGAVATLVQELAPALGDLPPDQAAVRLQALVANAQRNEVRREDLEKQLQRVEKTLAEANGALAEADAEISRLLARARCETLEALEDAEDAAAQRRSFQEKLEEEQSTLMVHASGAPLEAFLAEVEAVNADRLGTEIEQLERDIAALETRCFELERQIGAALKDQEQTDGGDQAAAAADEAQAALAVIGTQAERYFRLRLAAEVLRCFLDRYREQNQDPVVCRAAQILPRLSCGSFARLKVGADETDQPVFLALRPTGDELGVEQLSDGARDQLFLSLRLASLERQLETGESLPFVIDDALVNFDDQRAAAALGQLAELARRTQVLFFTHHERLVELARRAVPAELLKVHRLTES